jgi:hypothetical protein
MLDLPLPQDPTQSELDDYLAEIDRALDDCFLADIREAMAQRAAAPAAGSAPAAA